MNLFLSEKPVSVRVVEFDGEPGFERPSVVRYTYSLDVEPDDIWLLCWRLPFTLREVDEQLQQDVTIEGNRLAFTCSPGLHDQRVEDIGNWIAAANRQKDDVLSARDHRPSTDATGDEASVLDMLTQQLAEELGIDQRLDNEAAAEELPPGQADDLEGTRLEDWG